MYFFINKIIKSYLLIFAFLLISCESEPLPVSSSFLNDNSFMIESFSKIEDVAVFQDQEMSTGNSYRLYSGNIHGSNSTAYLKINTSLLRTSKYCNINEEFSDESSIHSVDTVRLVLRTFTQLQDSEDSSIFFIDKQNLSIKGGFDAIYSWEGDSTIIFNDNISVDLNSLPTIDPELIEYDQYTMSIILPFSDDTLLTDEWCEHDCFRGDYYISINYNPNVNEGEEYADYIEFLSSQNYYQGTTVFRPSLRFIFNEFEDSTTYFDKWSLSDIGGVTASSSDDLLNVYYVHNQSLETKSKILLVNNIGNSFDNDVYNANDIYINDIDFENSDFSAGTYELTLNFEFNEAIVDSISMIDFFIDSIKIISNDIDPSDDNTLYEGNNIWDYIDENENNQYDTDEQCEIFYDLGTDNCPDNYEDPNSPNLCLCEDWIDYVNTNSNLISDLCPEENLVYNPYGTEGNGVHDPGEEFPSIYDCGEDGLCDINEEGEGVDPANDNYNIDPNEDNWRDYGIDGCPDKFEGGILDGIPTCLDEENDGDIDDPNNDNWKYGNVENGTEGNGVWDEGEGIEGNGVWDYVDINDNGEIDEGEYEPFNDWGIDGVPEDQEENCAYCNDDGDTEGNGVWDYHDQNNNGEYDIGENCEPFDDTGIDGLYTVYEEGYNPYGTEGNGVRDFGEDFPSIYDCGEDGDCNEEGEGLDPAGDNYNIDPNNDNWGDCGIDGDCDTVDEDGTQGNGIKDEGELGEQNNNQYDEGERFDDLGVDNLSDIIENLSSETSLNYYIPQTISYNIYSEIFPDEGPQNQVDSSKNVIFDIKSINYSEENSITTIVMDITSDSDFRALEFRLNHSPYISETFSEVHSKDLVHKINQDELFEDISIYNNSFLESDIFANNDNLILDYFNGIKFSFKFTQLEDWLYNNSNISVNYNYTTLVFYINHEHPNYNFFDGDANIWLLMGDEKRLLGVADVIPANSSQLGPLSASGEKQVLIPFGTIINEMIDGDLDINNSMTFMLDGGLDNTSRIVFHGYENSEESTSSTNIYAPRLELFYTK